MFKGSVTSPPRLLVDIPNDSDTSDLKVRCIYVGVTGDLEVTTTGGTRKTFVGLAAGVWHPMMIKNVWSAGTTADSIIGGW